MSVKCLTFLSDFGTNSLYPAQMKAVALGLTDAHMVDITHEIQPHNIREGAFVLRATAPLFPSGTVHVAVVDPGVGTPRRGLLITTKSQIFVGPDNGLLIPAAQLIGDMHVYELSNRNLMRVPRSMTFDGRDVFTSVAAHVLNGVAFDRFGTLISDYVPLDFGDVKQSESLITGEIIYIDRFGNIITNISKDLLIKQPQQDLKIKITVGEKVIEMPFVPSYGSVSPSQMLATIGSTDFVEIAVNLGRAADLLNAQDGMAVSMSYL